MRHALDPALTQAAALICHWERCDIEAFVLMLADLDLCETGQDLAQALVMLRGRPLAEVMTLLPPAGT